MKHTTLEMIKKDFVMVIIVFIIFMTIYIFYISSYKIWVWFLIIVSIIIIFYLIDRMLCSGMAESKRKIKFISCMEKIREFLKELIP